MLFKILIVSALIYFLSKKIFPSKKTVSKKQSKKDKDIIEADYKVVDDE